ncbi:competence protein ComG [Kurthia gibsonii]|nr:competence protein ComG [Kurthia gibsonii]
MGESYPMFLQRKKAILLRRDQPKFLAKLSTLLQEGYSLNDSLRMLIPHHLAHINQIEERIHMSLLEGKGLCDILRMIGISEQYIISLYVAEQSGTTVNALQMIAQMMNKEAGNKEQVLKLVSYPLFLFVFLVVLFICFRTFFLPNMETMMLQKQQTNQIQLTISKILLHLPDYLIGFVIVIVITIFLFLRYTKQKKTGEKLLLYFKIPIVNQVLRLQLTKQIAFELGSLLEAGFTLQASLHLLANQSHQKMIAYIAQDLLNEIAQGESLSVAISLNPYVHKEFYAFVVHGEQGGNLGKELQILNEFMNERMGERVEQVLKFMQPILFGIIAICILGAYISIMLPMYKMIDYV